MIARRVAGPALAALLAACGKPAVPGETTYHLPSELTEVSGLAVAGPDSVFTHDDEFAIIYEFRLRDGHVLRTFALGRPTIEGDFEGIATAGAQVFLVTSDGLIYAAEAGDNGARVPYRVYDSGIGPRCEVEGLSQAPTAGDLLLLCKRLRNDPDDTRLEVYLWHIGAERAEAAPFLSLPLDTLLDEADQAEFRPSGLEWDPAARHLLVVSGRNRMVLYLDPSGKLLDRKRLSGERHPKTEGITILPGGRLVLADEGSRTREGRLTVYKGTNASVAP
jgi:uncharacterized protein YjiK